MPIARVQAPDGKILRLEVPEGATHEQIAAFAQSQYKPEPLGFFDSATLGMKKAGVGTIQLGMDAARQFGYEFPETYAVSEKAARQLDEQGRGSGVAGAIGEALGNPLTLPMAAASMGTSLLGMAGIGAAQGAASGAIDPTQDGESRLENAAVGGVIGGVAAPVMKVAGDAISDFVGPYIKPFIKDTSTGIGRGAVKLDKPVIRPYEEIQKMAIQSYDDAAKAGGVIRPQAVNKIIAKAQAIGAKSPGTQRFQGGAKDAVDTVVAKMQNLQNRGMTLKDVQEIDDILQDSISKEFVAGSGITNEGRKISKIRDMFHNAHAELAPYDFIGGSAGFKAWREGDRLFAASSNAKQIEAIIENAASADHPAMALKTGFRTLLRNKKNLRGFTPEELKFVKHAANTGAVTDLLRTIGSKLNPIVHGGIGGLDSGATVYGVSRFSRELANRAQGARADKVLEAITSRATGSPMPVLRTGTTALGGLGGAVGAGAGVSGITQIPESPKVVPQQPVEQPAPQSSIADPLQDRIAMAESGGKNIGQHSPLSSASGLFGFTKQTWKDSVRKYGNDVGVKMGDRNNPDAQRRLESALRSDHAAILRKSLNREPTDGELYLAHFVGVGGAKRLLKAPSGAPAARILPSAVRKNKNGQIPNKDIFYDNNNHMRTVSEVISIISGKV